MGRVAVNRSEEQYSCKVKAPSSEPLTAEFQSAFVFPRGPQDNPVLKVRLMKLGLVDKTLSTATFETTLQGHEAYTSDTLHFRTQAGDALATIKVDMHLVAMTPVEFEQTLPTLLCMGPDELHEAFSHFGLGQEEEAPEAQRPDSESQGVHRSRQGTPAGSVVGSRRASTDESATKSAAGDNSSGNLSVGMLVRLEGLQKAQELNGMCGTLVEFDGAAGRWHVNVAGLEKSIKPENLVAHVVQGTPVPPEGRAQQRAKSTQARRRSSSSAGGVNTSRRSSFNPFEPPAR